MSVPRAHTCWSSRCLAAQVQEIDPPSRRRSTARTQAAEQLHIEEISTEVSSPLLDYAPQVNTNEVPPYATLPFAAAMPAPAHRPSAALTLKRNTPSCADHVGCVGIVGARDNATTGSYYHRHQGARPRLGSVANLRRQEAPHQGGRPLPSHLPPCAHPRRASFEVWCQMGAALAVLAALRYLEPRVA